MTRTVVEIQLEINDVIDQRNALNSRMTGLMRELGEAKVAEQPEHPWAGKKVRRQYSAYRMSSARTQRGIVAQNTNASTLYGGKGHCPDAGEYYVRSSSGATFYSLRKSRSGGYATDWELDV